ncbi:MAG: ribbon-helix-helix protein, CopG family [Candidatus Lokiarchaeota archaeon]|nr:ribbon-helix-helix protein, CopG family [Candidatus Lokiarchaeota archaeon]
MPIISLQVTDELLERFEIVRRKSGFQSKSEALRSAIVNFIENHENFENMDGYKIMTINLVYPLKEVTTDEITELFSQFSSVIKTVSDWRIAEKKIETILTVGEFGIIKDLHQKLSNIRDVTCSIHEIIID